MRERNFAQERALSLSLSLLLGLLLASRAPSHSSLSPPSVFLLLPLSPLSSPSLRESTDMQLRLVQQMPKEPPGGRYSNLLGRYIPAETFRIQAQYERALKYRPRDH
jgi:hypothetical protein